MNVKYQIFVSSTYEDLRDERNEVIKACLNMGHIPVGMEMFNAADEEQWAVITRTIEQCDYYVVIIAYRYGSTTPEGISFTEKEYNYAVEQGVPVLGFIIAEDAAWPNTKKDEQQDALEALKGFKTKIKQKMVRFWHSAPELRAQFVESLATSINTKPRRGWTRAPEAGDADVAQTISNLSDENARLRQTLDEMRSKDEVNDIMNLLTDEIDNRSGQDFLIDLIESSRRGGEISESAFAYPKWQGLNPAEHVERQEVLSKAVRKLGLWGLIEPSAKRPLEWTLTPLGRRVYNRLNLEKRAEPPF